MQQKSQQALLVGYACIFPMESSATTVVHASADLTTLPGGASVYCSVIVVAWGGNVSQNARPVCAGRVQHPAGPRGISRCTSRSSLAL